jgi:hypothetical protein
MRCWIPATLSSIAETPAWLPEGASLASYAEGCNRKRVVKRVVLPNRPCRGAFVETDQHTAILGRLRILLVNDSSLGSAVAEDLIIQGYEVFWARDTMEARWLWLPKFYDLVLIRLPQDTAAANALVERMKREAPKQRIEFWNEWDGTVEAMPTQKHPVSSVGATVPSVIRSAKPRPAGQLKAKVIEMPKRAGRPRASD